MPSNTLTSDSCIWPKESQSSLLCDGQLMDNIVDEFGVNVKIRVVSKDSTNNYGDATKSYTDTISRAYIHQWLATDDEVKEGIYINGQISFVFKNADKAIVKPGNLIFFNSAWYKITDLREQILAGITYLINAQVDKTLLPP